MVEPTAAAHELTSLLEMFRLGLAVHLVAEARVLDTLLALVHPPAAVRLQIARLREEHRTQQLAAERLTKLRAGSDEWYSATLELRVLLLDHAKREDYLRVSIDDHVSTSLARGLVAQYATERMRLLATTSPVALAHSVHAA